MPEMRRRTFLKLASSTTAAVTVASSFKPVEAAEWQKQLGQKGSQPDPVKDDVKVIRSLCLMCNGLCGIQVKVKDGVAVKIDGNPYHPNNYDYVAKGPRVVEGDLDAGPTGQDIGTVCAKGQAGIYELYNPARITHPLKRAGARGSGKWRAITWEEAITEIVEGGKLFKDVPGEENRAVEGLRKIRDLKTPLGPADSDYMDEAPPGGWGPKANQLVWFHGRNQQSAFTKRWITECFGSPNYFTH